MLAAQKETCGCQCFHSLKDKFERKGTKNASGKKTTITIKRHSVTRKKKKAFRGRMKSEAEGLRGVEPL